MTTPQRPDLAAIADDLRWFSLDETEVGQYETLAAAVLDVLDLVHSAPLPGYERPRPVDAGSRVSTERSDADDPLNAVLCWTDIAVPGADGPLAGLRIAVKDSVSMAGIPMTLGSAAVQDYRASVDSVVTSRLLSAGGRIVAVTNMDDFAFSGGGETSAFGAVRNPHDLTRSAGGSSGGSAAALSYDGIDGAIGTDQGGSVRVPAAWCGVLGLKPTHGLVPYTDIVGIDATFDHAGPMATNVDVLARLLLAIAGPDPSDPRQAGTSFDPDDVEAALGSTAADFEGMRIGLLTEGFSDADADRAATSREVRAVAEALASAGAVVEPVSVPEHLLGGGVAFAGFIEGMSALALAGGNGYHRGGRYNPELALAMNAAFMLHGQELSPQIKLVALLGEHLRRRDSGAGYAAAQNQRPLLRAAYDRALDRYDVLLLPTVAYHAHELRPELGLAERALRGWEPLGNCTPLNMTGHPAITIPAAHVDGLPVGVMLVGRHQQDALLIDLAGRYERRFGWASPS
jgi:amidase